MKPRALPDKGRDQAPYLCLIILQTPAHSLFVCYTVQDQGYDIDKYLGKQLSLHLFIYSDNCAEVLCLP